MFIYHTSNSLSELIAPLSEALSEYRKDNPLKKTWLVVQNKETQQWLSLELARISGISFNIEFVLPSEFIWKLYRLVDPELPSILPSDRFPMQWKLFDILENQSDNQLAFNKGGTPETRFQFAGQIADVFDLYQIYRPGILKAWQERKYLTKDPSEPWQARLWNTLFNFWKKEYPNLPTRAEVFFKLKELIIKQDNKANIPDSVFVFGNSHLSASFFNILEAISTSSDIHFFRNDYNLIANQEDQTVIERDWTKPSIEAGALIKLIRSRLGEAGFKEINIQSDSDSVLSKLELSDPKAIPVAIHSCHNERREVEVLKDQLLSHFNSDDTLDPEDVLILVPDIQKYGGIIESVFSGDSEDPVIPIYNPASHENRVAEDFLYLLDVLDSDFKASEIIEFLSRSSVQERFNISEEETFTVKQWLVENNIHWGLTTDDSNYSLAKASFNLLSGYMMEIQELQSLENHIPYRNIDSSEKAELAARFSYLVRFLESKKKEILISKPFCDWVKTIRGFFEFYTPANPKNENEWSSSLHSITRLEEIASVSHSGVDIDFRLFKHWFKRYISNEQASSTRFGNGVMLSTFIPYRGIPFKQVYMLGMNEKEFPRNTIRPSFDLINKYPQAGDRISKQDDALLFYELLSNTSDFLSISYIGQDMYSNEDKLPSVLVQKLTDVYPFIKIEKHKLHGFDSEYFSTAFSFSKAQKKLADRITNERQRTTPLIDAYDLEIEEKPKVDLNELITFFSHPSKYMLSRLLQVKAPFENREPEDREVFRIAGLAKYNIDHLLAKSMEENQDTLSIENFALAAGLVPQGLPGTRDFENEIGIVSDLLVLANTYKTQEESEIDIYEDNTDYQYEGTVKVRGLTRLIVKPSRLKSKDFISAWIQHLSLQLVSKEFQTVLIGRNGYNTHNIGYLFSEIELASELCDGLIKKYLNAFSSKDELAFFPESSRKYVETLPKGDEEALTAARSTWEGSEYSAGESLDFYNELNWRGTDPIRHPAFSENALFFWSPLLENLQKSS